MWEGEHLELCLVTLYVKDFCLARIDTTIACGRREGAGTTGVVELLNNELSNLKFQLSNLKSYLVMLK